MPAVNVPGVGRVNFPDDMTPEQIEAAVERDVLPQASAPARQPDPRTPDYKSVFTDTSRLGRFNRGTQDVLDRVSQLAIGVGEKTGLLSDGLGDISTQQINKERADYEKARFTNTGDSGIDPYRIGGSAATLSPLGLVPGGAPTAIGRTVAGAVSGGLSGALQYDESNSAAGTAKNVGVGAASGAVARPVLGLLGDKAGKVFSSLAGRFKGAVSTIKGDAGAARIAERVPEITSLPATAQREAIDEAASQIRTTGSLNAEALGRKANLLANNVTPTKSMVTRNPQDYALERNLSKLASNDPELNRISGELTDVYSGNDAALAGKLRSFGTNLPKGTQENLGKNVVNSIDDLQKASQQEVGKIYQSIRDAKGAEAASDAARLKATLDDLQDNTYAEKLVSSVRNKLRRFGMIDENGELTPNVLTVTQAEELRKFVNKLPNDFGKRDIIRAIDEDVLQGSGEDAFAPARKAAAERFATIDNPAAQKAINSIGELSEGKTAQNFIKTNVIDAAEQDVAALIQTVGKDKAAIDSIQAGVLNYLESKAVNPNGGQFSGAAFNKALQAIGEGKLQGIFGPEVTQQLKSLSRAALDATYQPPYAAVNSSNTAPALLSLAQNARKLPFVPSIVTDELKDSAARSGYRRQLAEALAARSVPVSDGVRQQLASLLSRASPAAAVPANQARNERSGKK